MITIDGLAYDMLGDVKRIARMESSEISGMMLDKRYFNDVLGTWCDYDVTIAVPYNRQDDYEELHAVLTEPVPYHTFVLPYGQDQITIVGRVEQVEDVPYKVKHGLYWAGITFRVLSSHPTRTVELGDVITIGLPDLPSVSQAQIGDIYQYAATGWVQRYWPDVDEVSY
jgi:hypothetical protein